jgi:pimeloyl-ACP methyl ester carboxylesterase
MKARKMFIWIAALLAAAAVAAAILVWAACRSDMRAARERIRGKSAVVATPYGDVEYAEGGEGPDVLVVHGAGGGYDQGELVVEAVLDERFRWVAPSRFGYLRSTFCDAATYDDQARAYACLLDDLGVQRVAVVAISAGGPSALLFALLYPERVSSLTLISCGVAPVATENQKEADKKGKALVGIFKRDISYWLIARLFKKRLMKLMGAGEAVIAGLSPRQLEWVERFIDYMNPASMRYAGAAFDNTGALPGDRVAGIRAPTLIIHAEDDTIQLYDNAAFAAATIPGARLLRFDKGGHFVVIIEHQAWA